MRSAPFPLVQFEQRNDFARGLHLRRFGNDTLRGARTNPGLAPAITFTDTVTIAPSYSLAIDLRGGDVQRMAADGAGVFWTTSAGAVDGIFANVAGVTIQLPWARRTRSWEARRKEIT